MADNKKNRGARDRATVSANEGYELAYFARKHKITWAQARLLIDRYGNNRAKLNSEAARLKERSQ